MNKNFVSAVLGALVALSLPGGARALSYAYPTNNYGYTQQPSYGQYQYQYSMPYQYQYGQQQQYPSTYVMPIIQGGYYYSMPSSSYSNYGSYGSGSGYGGYGGYGGNGNGGYGNGYGSGQSQYSTGYFSSKYNYNNSANYANYPRSSSYSSGRYDALGNELCYWSDYPSTAPCGTDPQQWVFDPYTGTWY